MAHTLLWANTDAKNGYLLLRGNIKSGIIKGVMSCWSLDVSNYDEDVISQNPYADASILASVQADQTLTPAGEYIVHTPDDNTAPVTTTIADDTKTTNDDVLKIPPRPVLKKRTYIELWDNAAGDGNLLAFEREDRFINFVVSESPSSFIS